MRIELTLTEWSIVMIALGRAQDTIYRDQALELEHLLEKINDALKGKAGE